MSIGDVNDLEEVARLQEIKTATLTNMAALFQRIRGFLLFGFSFFSTRPACVLGAVAKEAGWRYMLLVFSWSTGLAYAVAICLYQLPGPLPLTPNFQFSGYSQCCLQLCYLSDN